MSQSRRDFLKTLGAAAAGATLGLPFARGAATFAPGKRPRNLLFLICDEHRPDALGRYGDPNALTPALDALAASGMSFRQTYTQNPICVPARNSILMGRYCHSTGALTNVHQSRRDLTTFPQFLRSKGYTAVCFGKLHTPGRGDLDWDQVVEGRGGRAGAKAGEDRGGRVEARASEDRGGRAGAQAGEDIRGGWFGGKDKMGAPSPLPEDQTLEWATKEATIAFLKGRHDGPWVVQCSMYKPHPPFTPPKRYWDMIDRSKLEVPRYPEDDMKDKAKRYWEMMTNRHLDHLTDDQVRDGMQGYYGNVAFADAMLGEALKTVDDLGLRDDILIVYTSDHGEMLDDHRLWMKMVFFDPSVRVPLILSCPGVVPAGRETQALTQHIDLFPTFMDMLGFETPPSVQGLSMVPLLTGAKDAIHDVIFSEHYPQRGGPVEPTRMIYDGRYKYIDNGPDETPEFYDRQTDPREITNLCNAPELAQRERMEALAARLREFAAKDIVEPGPLLPSAAQKIGAGKAGAAQKGGESKTGAAKKSAQGKKGG
ncbi:MAG: sulfatase-like hydrolase/transferase [Candidatus Sumerlaeota bacterium]|nr:sulfatase-like hydrolase/transferase [Candidatus Sumerlaeota bacterium]